MSNNHDNSSKIKIELSLLFLDRDLLIILNQSAVILKIIDIFSILCTAYVFEFLVWDFCSAYFLYSTSFSNIDMVLWITNLSLNDC